MKGSLRQFPVFAQILIVFGLMMILGSIFSYLGMAAGSFLLDIPITPDSLNWEDPQNPDFLKIVQIFSAIGTFVLPPFITVYLLGEQPKKFFRFGAVNPWQITLVILIMLTAAPLMGWAYELNQSLNLPESMSNIEEAIRNLEQKAEKLTKAFMNVSSIGGLVLNLVMIGILAGIGEELFFRGTIQQLFTRWFGNIHVSVLVTAFIFSAIHAQFYGFLPRMMLGVLFGYLFVWSGNILIPIFAHFFHNGYQVVLYYLYNIGNVDFNIDEVDHVPLSYVLPGTLIFAGLLYIFYRTTDKNYDQWKRIG